jgi:uncharacterized protein (TIGR00297 family)
LIFTGFLYGFIFGLIISIISYRVKFLSLSGSIAAVILATIIFGSGQWQYTVPILTFFLLSSLLSKTRKTIRNEIEESFEKSSTRDFWQVFANGLIPSLIAFINLVFPFQYAYLFYLVSIAVATADTWGTEIGTFKKTRTYNIRNFNEVEQGISGGVSLLGFVGSVLGALTIGLSSLYWIEDQKLYFIAICVSLGVLGSLYDSILGSTIQAQYICVVCKKVTERQNHCKINTHKFKGISWINNDIINIVSISMSILTLFILLSLI